MLVRDNNLVHFYNFYNKQILNENVRVLRTSHYYIVDQYKTVKCLRLPITFPFKVVH